MPRKRRLRDEEFDDVDADDSMAPRRRRSRWRLKLGLFLAAVVGLIAATPTIVSKTPLRNLLLSAALPPDSGLSVQGGSFSWLGDQTLTGVALVDAAGQPVFGAEAITVERSLIALAANPRDIGKIVVLRPTAMLDIRPTGSNIEELIDKLKTKAEQTGAAATGGTSGPVLAEVEIVEGRVFARDAATGQQWRVEGLSANVRPSPEIAGWEASGTGAMIAGAPSDPAPEAGATGRFKFQLRPAEGGTQQIELIADHLPLAPIEPWLARKVRGARLAGFASTDLRANYAPGRDGRPQVAATGKIDAAQVHFTADALAGDLVDLPRATIALDAALANGRITARQFEANSDGIEAKLAGEFDLAELSALGPRKLPTRDANLTLQVNLSKLAAMLPRTLRLREGLRIDSGVMEISARSSEAGGKRLWTAAAAVEDLVGSNGRKAIRWTQPVEAGVNLTDSQQGPQLERLLFRTPFATADAHAEADGFSGDAKFNLGDVARELGQFVDLSAWKLRGAGEGQFRFRPDGDRFAATATMDLAEIDVRRDGKPVWVDEKLRVELDAAGQRRGLAPQRIETGKIFMRGPADTLTAELVEPFAVGLADQNLSLKVDGAGPLQSWAGRLRPWIAAIPPELTGQATLQARLRARAGFVEVAESQLAIEQFQMRSGSTEIAEPRIEAQGDLRFDAAGGTLESESLQFSSSTLAARARNLSLRFADNATPSARGEVAFRSDLGRLATWRLWNSAPGSLQPRGQAVGKVQLTSDARRASGNLTVTVEPFKLVRTPVGGAQPVDAWSDPRVELSAAVAYDQLADRLQLSEVRLNGQTAQASGSATIDQARTIGVVSGDVNIAYDSNQLARLLAGYLGPNVRLEGANQFRLTASGRLNPTGDSTIAVSNFQPQVNGLPHWSRAWQGTSEAGWSAANIFGMPVGPARIIGNLRDGTLDVSPLDLAVGQGRVSIKPRVVFDPPPAQLILAPGPLATNVAISAEVSEAMLKYAAPVIAGATRTEGAFSAQLDSLMMPLGDTKQMRGSGRLTIHRLSVTPGPMIADIVNLVSQIEALGKGQPLGALGGPGAAPKPISGVTMSERTIDVQVQDGRVYHRNLEFMIDDVPVRSYGSVGFDETLALMIEVPIQKKWVGSRRALQNLVGQPIQIPVQGTFSKPKIDERAIGNLSTQLLQGAAQGALGDELGKALDKLFKPRQ